MKTKNPINNTTTRYKYPGTKEKFLLWATPLSMEYPSSNTIIRKDTNVGSYIMAGTHDAIMKTSETILVELLQLKSFVEDTFPGCIVVISCPTYRYDDPKACLAVLHMHRKLII